jgi:ferredoxin-NADP reductase
MSQHSVRIKSIKDVTHDTISLTTEKPENYNFKPGQATMIALDRDGWRDKKRPFTFTSLPEDDYIEFTIKTYPEHDGATDKLLDVREGENLILFDIFGTIVYRGEGVFIAGGAGVTPFISILRDLHKKGEIGNNKLIYANKTRRDIMLREDFEKMLGDNFINILSEEKTGEYPHGFITADFLKEHVDDFDKYFYICGPPVMIRKLEEYLSELDVDKELIVKEEF